MAEDVEATHRSLLGQRFDEYFGELRRTHAQLSVSRLAEEFGYADSRFLDGLREGREYPKWNEIDGFCSRSGLHADWLKHGEDHPFSPEYAELDDLNALLRELEPRGDWPLYAVRSDCSEGLVCFVRRDSKYAWRIYDTTLHLSARNGGGGRMNLVRLYRLPEDDRTRRFGRCLRNRPRHGMERSDCQPYACEIGVRHAGGRHGLSGCAARKSGAVLLGR